MPTQLHYSIPALILVGANKHATEKEAKVHKLMTLSTKFITVRRPCRLGKKSGKLTGATDVNAKIVLKQDPMTYRLPEAGTSLNTLDIEGNNNVTAISP